ncbi:hypothetical protein DFH06DRAFT_1302124 [Mycena polygramma]|nr:hypothetical protein DFH06DRAFT_1302124 [Mycena polygramma]
MRNNDQAALVGAHVQDIVTPMTDGDRMREQGSVGGPSRSAVTQISAQTTQTADGLLRGLRRTETLICQRGTQATDISVAHTSLGASPARALAINVAPLGRHLAGGAGLVMLLICHHFSSSSSPLAARRSWDATGPSACAGAPFYIHGLYSAPPLCLIWLQSSAVALANGHPFAGAPSVKSPPFALHGRRSGGGCWASFGLELGHTLPPLDGPKIWASPCGRYAQSRSDILALVALSVRFIGCVARAASTRSRWVRHLVAGIPASSSSSSRFHGPQTRRRPICMAAISRCLLAAAWCCRPGASSVSSYDTRHPARWVASAQKCRYWEVGALLEFVPRRRGLVQVMYSAFFF